MKFEDVLRGSDRVQPSAKAVARWHRAVFVANAGPGWWPSVASGLAMASMLLLLWPAAARGPLVLRSVGEACDGRWERSMPLKTDVRAFARQTPPAVVFAAADRCVLCHLPRGR